MIVAWCVTIARMLKALILLFGIFIILVAAEVLWRKKILGGEAQRKFVHIFAGSFIAFWPWFVSWRAIQLMGAAMLAGVLINRRLKFLHSPNGLRVKFYSDCYYAVAIIICALLTTHKAFFAVAILTLALADGFAAITGRTVGKKWGYKVFGQTKTVIGSMVFWLVAMCVLGVGIALIGDSISFAKYALLVIFLPPVLTILENVAISGTDNIVIPIAVLIAFGLS